MSATESSARAHLSLCRATGVAGAVLMFRLPIGARMVGWHTEEWSAVSRMRMTAPMKQSSWCPRKSSCQRKTRRWRDSGPHARYAGQERSAVSSGKDNACACSVSLLWDVFSIYCSLWNQSRLPGNSHHDGIASCRIRIPVPTHILTTLRRARGSMLWCACLHHCAYHGNVKPSRRCRAATAT